MTTLVLATSFSSLFAAEIVREMQERSIVVVAATPEVNHALKQAGVPSQLITTSIPETWEHRDRKFKDLAMPGVFGQEVFPGTDLPLWRVLSIDRLSFWNHGENGKLVCQFIEMLEWDRLLTDLNIHSPYPFFAALLAKERGAFSCAVQTGKIEPELQRMNIPFDTIILEEEVELSANTVVRKQPEEGNKRTIGKVNALALRNGLGATRNQKIIGVVFDKRYEFECRQFVESLDKEMVLFFADDARSKDLLPRIVPGARIYSKAFVPACDRIIAFSQVDGYENLEVIDGRSYQKSQRST